MTKSANLEDAHPLTGHRQGELIQELINLVPFCVTPAEVADLLSVASNLAWHAHELVGVGATDWRRAQVDRGTENQFKSLRHRRAKVWTRALAETPSFDSVMEVSDDS